LNTGAGGAGGFLFTPNPPRLITGSCFGSGFLPNIT
jgi:hypothetical protein